MKHIKIVPMAAEHLNDVAALELACFSRPWSRQMLAEELDNQCAAFLVALEPETEKVIGYAGLLVAADEGYITNVAVDPSRRRQGVAAQLLQVFDNFARGNQLAFLTLEVRPSAKELISEAGFDEKYGARPLKRAIQTKVEDALAQEILEGRVKAGDTVAVGVSKKEVKFVVKNHKELEKNDDL